MPDSARARLLLLACLLAAALLPAQTLIVQNLATVARREWCAAVVPFAKGAVPTLPDLHVAGLATVWQPFGARWPDGSLRQARCLFRVEVPPLAELALPLQPGPGPALAASPIALPPVQLRFDWRAGDRHASCTPLPVERLEDNAARSVWLLRGRLGDSGLCAEAIATVGAGQSHLQLDLAVTCSDPRLPAMQCPIDELSVTAEGMALVLRHAGRLGIVQQATATGSRAVLLSGTWLADGQSLLRTGVLVPRLSGRGDLGDRTLQAAVQSPLLAATDWRPSGAFGPFGVVPEPPPWLDEATLRRQLAARHAAFTAGDRPGGDPFAAGPLGLAKFAGQTGDQDDFGVTKLLAVAGSGLPSLLLEVEASLLQEGLRPVHQREADGSMVQAAAHPRWVVWSGRTHWHAGVSPDRLGKPSPEPPFDAHGWTGKDREHWSSNYLGAYAQLTGAHWAIRELQNEVQLYLAGQTVAPELSTSHGGAPRGVGRTELAACWMHLGTGDPALLARMRERLDRVYRQEYAALLAEPRRVHPLEVHDPDPRNLGGRCRYWTPWQDAIAAAGLAAMAHATGEPLARQLAEAAAGLVVRHGFLVEGREAVVAMAMRWDGPEPLPVTALQDPAQVAWGRNSDFSLWSLGAVEIARAAAAAAGDRELQLRAEAIQRLLRANRRAPKSGLHDRLADFDAVRWPPP